VTSEFLRRGRFLKSRTTRVIELPFEMINLLTEALIFSAQSIALALSLIRTLVPINVVRRSCASSVFGRSGTLELCQNSPRSTRPLINDLRDS